MTNETARRAATRKQLRDENLVNRKKKIKAAARNLFFKKGYRLTTIEQIAKTAGYSKY